MERSVEVAGMDEQVQAALARDRVIDITTTGRKSGRTTRKEIWFHNVDGQIYITGLPGKRDWYANVVASPSFMFHLKQSHHADLSAQARPITDPHERREVLRRILTKTGRLIELERWIHESPLVAVTFAEG